MRLEQVLGLPLGSFEACELALAVGFDPLNEVLDKDRISIKFLGNFLDIVGGQGVPNDRLKVMVVINKIRRADTFSDNFMPGFSVVVDFPVV